jgi:hypothetical protein
VSIEACLVRVAILVVGGEVRAGDFLLPVLWAFLLMLVLSMLQESIVDANRKNMVRQMIYGSCNVVFAMLIMNTGMYTTIKYLQVVRMVFR